MTEPVWWTDADQAELDAIVHELVRAGWAHRTCPDCLQLGTWCPAMRKAAEAAFEWRRARELLSRAELLRALHDYGEAA